MLSRLPALKERLLSSPTKRGTVWSFAGFATSNGIRLISNVILTRMLFEEAFGLMALVVTFLVGISLFSDVGIGPSIIQNERGDDRDFVDTAWTIQVIRGAVLWLCCIIGAAPVAAFYESPDLRLLIPVCGVTAFINGFNSTKMFTANRHLDIARLTIIEVATQLSCTIVMIIWAYYRPTVWALAGGSIISTMIKTAMTHWYLPGRTNRFRWEASSVASLVKFGRWIFLSTLFTFMVQYSDKLIFGKLIPINLLGVYNIGSTLALLPLAALTPVMTSVLFPRYSQAFRDNVGELATVLNRTRMPLLVLAAWACAGFVAGGQIVIDILYDARYAEAGWMVQVVAAGAWFTILESAGGIVLISTGKPQWLAAANASKLVAIVVLVPLGFQRYGFPGALVAYTASELARYGVVCAFLMRDNLYALATDFKLGAWLAVTAYAGYETGTAAAEASNAIVGAIVVFVVVSMCWTPVAQRLWRSRAATSSPAPATT